MENLIDIYTKIKLRINTPIIVTYYSTDENKHTDECILLDIKKFYYLYVKKNNVFMHIPFCSYQTIIESITFKGHNKPIYFNPYANPNTFTKYVEFKEHMNSIFNHIEEPIKEREILLNKYLAYNGFLSLDELFFSEKQKDEFNLFFNQLIKELSEYAKSKSFDHHLKLISTGATSVVYEIGDKIIKIGKPRRIPIIPYCEFILQPIINHTIEFDGYPIHIEVTQKVLAIDNKDGYAIYSEDERFNEIVSILKKEFYEIGLKSNDLHPGNVGILLNDNKIHFDPITFDTSSDEVTSIKNNNNFKILQKGRYVILDLDSIEIENETKYTKYLEKIKAIPHP